MPLLSLGLAGRALSQEGTGTRILVRQARVLRNDTGGLRVIEALRVALAGEVAPDSAAGQPLRLFDVQPGAHEVMGVGGDLAPTQVIFEPPSVMVIGPFGGPRFGLILTYLLPADAPVVEFAAALPQDTFLLEIERGAIDARPDDALRPVASGGSDARPLRRYQALAAAPGTRFRIEIDTRRLGWRGRVAVLIATGLAAVVAGLALWRRGRGAAAATGDGATDARY